MPLCRDRCVVKLVYKNGAMVFANGQNVFQQCHMMDLERLLFCHHTKYIILHGPLNVPIEHHPTIGYMVYNGYYKVMSNIPKMGHLPIPVLHHRFGRGCLVNKTPHFFAKKNLPFPGPSRCSESARSKPRRLGGGHSSKYLEKNRITLWL